MQFPEFVEFKTKSKTIENDNETEESEKTPEEVLEYSYQKLRDNIAQELLANVKTCSPQFFEKLVIDLLLKMGDGGSRKDASEAIGRRGDEDRNYF